MTDPVRPDAPDTLEPWQVQAREEIALDRELVGAMRTICVVVVGVVVAAAAVIWWLL